MEDQSGDGVIKPTCPEGFDYRQLRLYLRNSEEGIPPRVWHHIQTCDACQTKWQFLEKTDPIVKAEFESRVRSIAEQVVTHEIIFHRQVAPVPPVAEDVMAAKMEREIARSLANILAGPNAERAALQAASKIPGLERIETQQERLDPRFVVGICDHVRSTPDGLERKLKAKKVRALFNKRLEREIKNRTVTYELLIEAANKLMSGAGQEPLSDQAIEVAATLPEMALATDPPLLTLVEGKPVFNSAEFLRIRTSGAA